MLLLLSMIGKNAKKTAENVGAGHISAAIYISSLSFRKDNNFF